MSQINVDEIFDADGGDTAVLHGVLSTPLGMRNKIINGSMDISQRGTTFTASPSGTYTLDRFQWQQNGAGIGTHTQQTDVPSTNEFQSSYRYTVTTADASIAATDIYYIRHAIEGYNVRDLIGKTFTLSFWVRSSKVGTHCACFQNTAADRSFIKTYTVNVANTWEYKTLTVPGGLPTAGTWNWTNGIGLTVNLVLAAGSNFASTADTWLSSSSCATSAQVNCLDTVGNIFAFTGVQLEVGETATPFEHRLFQTELALCQRYFEVIWNDGATDINWFQNGTAGMPFITPLFYRTSKRAVPTVTLPPSWSALTNVGTPTLRSASRDALSIIAIVSAAGNFEIRPSAGTAFVISAEL